MIAENSTNNQTESKEEYTLEKLVEKKIPILGCIIITALIIIINKVRIHYPNRILLYVLCALIVIIILLYLQTLKYALNSLLNKKIIKKLKRTKLLEEINQELQDLEINKLKSGKYYGYLNLKSYSVMFENTIKIFKYEDIKRLFIFTPIRKMYGDSDRFTVVKLKNGKYFRISRLNYYNDTRELLEKNCINTIYKKDFIYLVKYIIKLFLKFLLIFIPCVLMMRLIGMF